MPTAASALASSDALPRCQQARHPATQQAHVTSIQGDMIDNAD